MLRTFGTEVRRNLGLFLFPFVAGLVVYTSFETLLKGLWIWGTTSDAIQKP